jgi:hypothetical protein
MKRLLTLILGVALAACRGAEETTDATGGADIGSSQDDLTVGAAARASCGAAKFDAGLPHYKAAVAGAKHRFAGDSCQGGAMTYEIADNAAHAIASCEAFTTVIQQSPYALQLRSALEHLLTMKSLTGELHVLRQSPQDWSNVEKFIPGTSLWSTFEFGLLQRADRLEFEANGQGTRVHLDETGEDRYLPFTYRVEKVADEKGPRRVVIENDGKSTVYDLIVIPSDESNGWAAPVFNLRAVDDSEKRYTSWEAECDA